MPKSLSELTKNYSGLAFLEKEKIKKKNLKFVAFRGFECCTVTFLNPLVVFLH